MFRVWQIKKDEKKGVVVKDDTDDQKFMVIVKEKFGSDEVNQMVGEARKDSAELMKKLDEESKQQKEDAEKVTEGVKKEDARREQILAENNMMLDILAQIVTGQTSDGIKKTFEAKKEAFIQDKEISEDKIDAEGWTCIKKSVIEGYEFSKKKDMLESLGNLYGMQKVHIDEKKNQLLDKLLKTDGQDD